MYYFGYQKDRTGKIMSIRYDSDVLKPVNLVSEPVLLTDRQSISSLKSLEKKFPYVAPDEKV